MPKKYPLEIEIRPPTEADLPYIYSSWIRSWLNAPEFAKTECGSCGASVPKPDRGWAGAATHSVITRLLRSCSCAVACDPKDMSQVFGFIVGDPEGRVLHWIYVKFPFRRAGVGTRLMDAMFEGFPDAALCYTHKTPATRHLASKWGLREFAGGMLNRYGRSE